MCDLVSHLGLVVGEAHVEVAEVAQDVPAVGVERDGEVVGLAFEGVSFAAVGGSGLAASPAATRVL